MLMTLWEEVPELVLKRPLQHQIFLTLRALPVLLEFVFPSEHTPLHGCC